ncbi:hypothetical protein Tco_1024772 [Tanacetum coccineum]
MSDSQNSLREFYKTDVIPMSKSLYQNLKEIKEELIKEVQEMLNTFESMEQKVNEKSPTENPLQNEINRLLKVSLTSEIRDCVLLSVEKQKNELLKEELKKSSNDSKEIQANLLKRIKVLENNFKRSQAQSIEFELKLQHQKEKMACDVSWKSQLSSLNDENVLLKTQNQKDVNELIEHVNQKTYAYADVRAQNQDLLMTIFELKKKLRTLEKGKNVNTKFDKSESLRTPIGVTSFDKNLENKAKNVSNTKVNSYRSKQVTSQSTPNSVTSQKHNVNVIARGMYKITKQETKTQDSKANKNVSNSTGVESSKSVRRSKSKDNNSKNRVLKNTKSSSAYVWKKSSSTSLDSNKHQIKDLNACQTNTCVSNSKNVKACVNVVNDILNIVCVSCGNDVFLHSYEKCVARNALTRNSSVKRALFTTPLATKSKNLGATSVVEKSRLSVVNTPKATNNVSSASPLSPNSSQSRTLSSYMKNKIAASTRWQKWFEYQQDFSWTPKNKIAQSQSNVKKS